MKKQELLRIKAMIVAIAMAASLSACGKKAVKNNVNLKEEKASTVTSNKTSEKEKYVYPDNTYYSAVIIENDKALIYEIINHEYYHNGDNAVRIFLTYGEEITVPSDNIIIFEGENHRENAIDFANYYCSEVITYDDLKAQKRELTK